MSNWNFLNKYRVCREYSGGTPPSFWTTSADGWNGMFVFWHNDLRLRCICSDGEGWKRVSVSIIGDDRPPKWGTMCAIKDLFFEPEDCVVQFHPPQSDYVNVHPGCLHLWMPTGQQMPRPPFWMVGPKTQVSAS